MRTLAAAAVEDAPRPNVDRRRAGRGFAGQVAALGLVLVLGWFVAGSGAIMLADEGAALAQLDLVDSTGSFAADNPSPTLDPELEALPLELSERGPDGRWAPYAKHPTYIRLLDASTLVAGRHGPVLVSVLGTILAATGAGLLARRIRPDLAVPTLWLTGLGTPLLFDAYLVIAHAPAAACVAWSGVCTLRALETTARGRALAMGAIAALLAATSVLLRTEAALLVGGLVLGTVAIGGRCALRRRLTLAAGIGVAGAVTREVIEPGLVRSILDSRLAPLAAGGPTDDASWFADRMSGLTVTWLLPDYQMNAAALMGLAGAIALVAAVILCRRNRPGALPLVRVLAVLAAVGYCVRATGGGLVSGLVVACPLLIGVLAIDRDAWRSPAVRLGTVTWTVFAAGVLATQYPQGGSGEWGGRYFAIGLPLIVPAAVAGWRTLLSRLDHTTARLIGFALLVGTVALSAMSLQTMRRGREVVEVSVAEVLAAREQAMLPGGEPATVVATAGRTNRFAWESIDTGTWLTINPAALPRYRDRLAAIGAPIVLVTDSPEEELDVFDDRWTVVHLDTTVQPIAILTPRRP